MEPIHLFGSGLVVQMLKSSWPTKVHKSMFKTCESNNQSNRDNWCWLSKGRSPRSLPNAFMDGVDTKVFRIPEQMCPSFLMTKEHGKKGLPKERCNAFLTSIQVIFYPSLLLNIYYFEKRITSKFLLCLAVFIIIVLKNHLIHHVIWKGDLRWREDFLHMT